MRPRAIIVLAKGFEEMEAIISIDILRRAGIDAIIACIDHDLLVEGSRKINVQAQVKLENVDFIPDAVVLPGGMPGALNLEQSERVIELIKKTANDGKLIAAICASPAHALVKAGVLKGKTVTCYPGDETLFLPGTLYKKQDVVVDGNIITASGPGTTYDFALAIVKKLCGQDVAEKVKKAALIK
ncbi:MAG: DJ-1/PfpI family protein [Candidatus Omnitrophica bacterium]|nr:DJ-1/PfpI family protein [Candidatus Omnitrophota bacterium]